MTEPPTRRITLAAATEYATEVRHSRFLARAAPVDGGDAALDWLRDNAEPTAHHNCWAWRIGDDYRSSDDREPAGTAGRPILAAIDGQGFDRIVVVVARWFGGIKLGAGGLVRAYGGTASECLRLAERLPIVEQQELLVAFAFADTGAVHATLDVHRAEKLEEAFDATGIRIRFRIPADAVPALTSQLRDATRNRARLRSLA